MRRTRILLIVFASLAFGAAHADAAKLRTVVRSGVAGGGATGAGPTVTAVARCPKGTKAVSGGFTTSVPRILGASTSSRWFVVSESIMTPRGDGWRVSGSEHYPSPAASEFTAYAYCEKRRKSILVGGTVRTDTIPSVVGQTSGNTARCPKGTTAISGGFRTSATDAYFNRSRGFGRDWSVEVTNVGATLPGLYDVEAYCVRGKVRRVKADGDRPGSGGFTTGPWHDATTVVRGGRFVRGGGYGATPPAATRHWAAGLRQRPCVARLVGLRGDDRRGPGALHGIRLLPSGLGAVRAGGDRRIAARDQVAEPVGALVRGRLVADHLAVFDFADVAGVDEQVDVPDHLG